MSERADKELFQEFIKKMYELMSSTNFGIRLMEEFEQLERKKVIQSDILKIIEDTISRLLRNNIMLMYNTMDYLNTNLSRKELRNFNRFIKSNTPFTSLEENMKRLKSHYSNLY